MGSDREKAPGTGKIIDDSGSSGLLCLPGDYLQTDLGWTRSSQLLSLLPPLLIFSLEQPLW